jgi:hypothetical protein
MLSRKTLSDGRVLICVFLVSTVVSAFVTDYLIREWLLLAIVGAGIFGWFFPKSTSVFSALWAGAICGAGIALLVFLYRAAYG